MLSKYVIIALSNSLLKGIPVSSEYSFNFLYNSFEYHGERKTITQWSKIIGISRGTLAGRYYSGWSVEKILTEPLHNNRKQGRGGRLNE